MIISSEDQSLFTLPLPVDYACLIRAKELPTEAESGSFADVANSGGSRAVSATYVAFPSCNPSDTIGPWSLNRQYLGGKTGIFSSSEVVEGVQGSKLSAARLVGPNNRTDVEALFVQLFSSPFSNSKKTTMTLL